jgi:hypothetical protein
MTNFAIGPAYSAATSRGGAPSAKSGKTVAARER